MHASKAAAATLRSWFSRLIVGSIVWGLATAASAAIIVEDTFEDGFSNQPGNPRDVGWFTRFNNVPALSTAVDPVLGSGNVLVATNPFSGAGPILGVMDSAAHLGNLSGDSLRLSLDFRFISAIPNSDTGFRIGLFNSNGSVVVSDATGGRSTNDIGYHFNFATGTAAPSVGIFEQPSSGQSPGNFLGTSGLTTVGTDAPFAINDTDPHSAEFILTRISSSSMLLQLKIDGVLRASRMDSSVLTTSFDEITSHVSTANFDYRLDNVVLSTAPEPSSWALLASGALILGVAAARRKPSAYSL